MWRSQTSCTLFYNFTLCFSNFAQFYLVYKNLILVISTILLVNDSLFSLSRSCSVKILLLLSCCHRLYTIMPRHPIKRGSTI